MGVILLFFFLFFSFDLCSSENYDYVILIDAGSSGSRLHVFPYVQVLAELPKISPSINKKIKPGLSSYEADPDGAARSILELLDFAMTIIPEEQWEMTPVYLQATAGLRLLTQHAVDRILDSCRAAIERSPFYFEPHFATVISGKQEGLNGWIAVNYLRGAFNNQHSRQHILSQTVGVIEMGGASMQLTYAPHAEHEVGECERDLFASIKVGEHSFQLYTHSYLDYGLEKAQKLFQKHYMDVIEREGNPCYPPQNRHSAIGSYEKCAELIQRLFKTEECRCKSCAINGIFQPTIIGEMFYAIENFFYTSKFFGVEGEHDFALDLKQHGSEFCSTPWPELLRRYPGQSPADLEKYCFSAAYIPQVLEQGFGFQETHLQGKVVVKKNIEGVDIDWALGAVLLAILNHNAFDVAAPGNLRLSGAGTTEFPSLLLGGIFSFLVVFILYRIQKRPVDRSAILG